MVEASQNVDTGLSYLKEMAIFATAKCQVSSTFTSSVSQVRLNIRVKQQQLQCVLGIAV
jgi:hypothetical protein